MGEESNNEQHSCLLHGCWNIKNVKEYILGVETTTNKRIDTMRNVLVTLTITILTLSGSYSLWAADKKDVQEDKVTKLEVEMKEHNNAWDRREKLDNALLRTLGNLNDFMVEQKVKMKIYHPPKYSGTGG